MVSLILIFFKFFYPVNQFYTITGIAQGTTYSISYKFPFKVVQKSAIDSIFHSLDNEFSLYKQESAIIAFNHSSRGILASQHLKYLISTAQEISRSTYGAFDITILPLAIIWGKFNKDIIPIPSPISVQSTLSVCGSEKIMLTADSLVKFNPGVMIDTDGIAQGYSVDVLATYLESLGIQDFLVEIGGEIKSKGFNLEGLPWLIDYPKAADYLLNQISKNRYLKLSNLAVSTSARFSKFTSTQQGKKSHIIDPRTGMVLENGIISVTVIANETILADAYDNGFMVIGIDSSINLANSIKNIGVHIVYETNNGEIKDTCNNYFEKFIDN